jgi:hypothetical protein
MFIKQLQLKRVLQPITQVLPLLSCCGNFETYRSTSDLCGYTGVKESMRVALACVLLGLVLLPQQGRLVQGRPTEQERVKLWYEAGNRWPPTWQEETDGMKRLMAAREKEIMAIPGADERWENWMQYTQSRLVPKFTARGFDKVRMPDSTFVKLKKALDNAIDNWDNVHS